MKKRRFPLWSLLGAVLLGALVFGSGAFSSPAPTDAQRANAIDSIIRCPSCEDLNVANSTAETAVVVRATVRRMVDEGKSSASIERFLVRRYGSSIVLDPPARGLTALVWILPVVGGLIATFVLVRFLVVRRSLDGLAGAGEYEVNGLGTTELEERRRFLVRSLADADEEHLAGDLSDDDYLALRQRELRRLGIVENRLGHVRREAVAAAGTATVTVRRPWRIRRSRWFLTGAVVSFAAAVIVLLVLTTAQRQPGQSVTGADPLTSAQRVEADLNQAASDQNRGKLTLAVELYQSVISGHPDNEVALAQLGWLEFQIGQQSRNTSLINDAKVKLDRAVFLNGSDYAARLYLGTFLLEQDANYRGAVAQYRQFLADHPPKSVVTEAAPVLRTAFVQAGQPLPSQFPGG